jgi:type VI secretion system secreted protein Hcp
MPIPAYMTIEGETQGEISAGGCSEDSIGTLSRADKEDTIQLQEFRHSIYVPTDPQSGQPTGPRVHQEIVVTKMQDKTSPLLFQAMCSGERITEAELQWFRISPAGEEEHYFTTTIENALITNIRSYMPDVISPEKPKEQNPAETSSIPKRGKPDFGATLSESSGATPRTHMEEVTLRYNKITWTHEICGSEGEDDWNAGEG